MNCIFTLTCEEPAGGAETEFRFVFVPVVRRSFMLLLEERKADDPGSNHFMTHG